MLAALSNINIAQDCWQTLSMIKAELFLATSLETNICQDSWASAIFFCESGQYPGTHSNGRLHLSHFGNADIKSSWYVSMPYDNPTETGFLTMLKQCTTPAMLRFFLMDVPMCQHILLLVNLRRIFQVCFICSRQISFFVLILTRQF